MRKSELDGKYYATPSDFVEQKKARSKRYKIRRKIKQSMIRNQRTLTDLIEEENYAR